jgi:hypothetical protein
MRDQLLDVLAARARCPLAVSLAGIREAIAGTGARYPLVLPLLSKSPRRRKCSHRMPKFVTICAEPDAGLTHLAYFSRRRDRGM